MVDGLGALGERLLPVELVGGPANAVANPVQYFVIPLILLLLLGARFRELGFAPGHAAWRVSALWAALPLAVWLVLLATGQLAPAVLLRRLLGNALQNGFFEEFLFRGALMTRLARRFSAAWTLVRPGVDLRPLAPGLQHPPDGRTTCCWAWRPALSRRPSSAWSPGSSSSARATCWRLR